MKLYSKVAFGLVTLLLSPNLATWSRADSIIQVDGPQGGLSMSWIDVETTVETIWLAPGESATLDLRARRSDGEWLDPRGRGPVLFSVTPNGVADVSPTTGVVTAREAGTSRIAVILWNADSALSAHWTVEVRTSDDDDGDGIPNDVEIASGLDPQDPTDPTRDPDQDGMVNRWELSVGTDPLAFDTDGDGTDDGIEVALGTDPLVADPPPPPPPATGLDETCTVAGLNRTAPVTADGNWVLPNVPSTLGRLRMRATCVAPDGSVRQGQSDFVEVPSDGVVEVAEFDFDAMTASPESLTLDAPATDLTELGEPVQLAATVHFSDGSSADVTADPGTSWTTSNAGIVALSQTGVATATASGRAIVSASHDGATGFVQLWVVAGGDGDGDGLPDDFELANGLDPADPLDALLDSDLDGLSALAEFLAGTDLDNPDTDGDGLQDGDEIDRGTEPLVVDTDGDGLSDGLEVQLGTDPLDPNSFDLAAALTSIEVAPDGFRLVFNELLGEGSRLLSVVGHLIDGRTLDLTRPLYGTAYQSSDLSVVGFGPEPGRVYAGVEGTATVTVSNSGFSDSVTIEVQVVRPAPLSFLALSGFPNGVAVDGFLVAVASGSAGLHVIDALDPAAPVLLGTHPLPGNANDVALRDGVAYVASGSGGLQILGLGSEGASTFQAAVATPGVATDVVVEGGIAYVADEMGVQLVDVSTPEAPQLLSRLETPGRCRGVAVDGRLLALADSRSGIHVADVSTPQAPVLLASSPSRLSGNSNAAAVALRGGRLYVADGAQGLGGLRVFSLQEPRAPALIASSDDGFGLRSVALDGRLALTADYFFVNSVPIFDVGSPEIGVTYAGQIDFSALPPFRDDNGMDVAVQDGLIYLAAVDEHATTDNGTQARSGGLFIGRYADYWSPGSRPPRIQITEPAEGTAVLERRELTVRVEAADDFWVDSVAFTVDGVVVATDYESPWQADVVVPSEISMIELGAVATDKSDLTGSAEPVHVTVLADDDPTVEILSPTPSLRLTGGMRIPVSVAARDDRPGLQVALAFDGVLAHTFFAPPYLTTLEIPIGSPTVILSATALDDGGQEAVAELTLTLEPDAPPSAWILEPRGGSLVEAGGLLEVQVGALDDLGVESVRLLVDGVEHSTSTASPHGFSVALPGAAGTLELVAVAADGGGQEGTSDPATVEVVLVDPLTTVQGWVEERDGSPVDGAEVVCGGLPGLSGPGGDFRIAGVPTVAGPIGCEASYLRDGVLLTGSSSPVAPVPAGVTDVGTVVVASDRGYDYPNPLLDVGAGGATNTIRIADLDEDGVQDIVLAQDYDTVAWYRGLGGGLFDPPVDLAVAGWAKDVAVVDLDEDGHLDLVVATTDDLVSVLLGHGDGTFTTLPTLPAGDGPHSVVTPDLDGDGVKDLAVLARFGNQLRLFTGAGDGTFTATQTLSVGRSPQRVVSGDFDGDGVPDLVLAVLLSNRLEIYRGNGDGTAAFLASVAVDRPTDVVTTDFNGDGVPDLAATDSRYGEIDLFLGLGGGSFAAGAPLDGCSDPTGLALADLDDDGRLDLACSSESTNEVAVFFAAGGGAFESARLLSAGSRPRHLAAGDLDGQGAADLAVADYIEVALLVSSGPREYDVANRVPVGTSPGGVELGDFDGDGLLDAAAVLPYDDALEVRLGTGDGRFPVATRHSIGSGAWQLAVADLDGDGKLDLVTANGGSDDVSVLLGLGGGGFAAETRYPAGIEPTDVLVSELTSDTMPEIVITLGGENAVAVLPGLGGGAFGAATKHPVGDYPVAVDAGEVNGDAFADLLVSNHYGDDLSLIAGTGPGTFAPERRLPAYVGGPYAGILRDIDGDGVLDVVVSATWDDGVVVLLGAGDGTFGAPLTAPTGFSPQDLDVADVNADGRLDVVVAKGYYENLSVLHGRGDGTFDAPQKYAAGMCTWATAIGDLDLDGAPDLVTANECSWDLAVYLHR